MVTFSYFLLVQVLGNLHIHSVLIMYAFDCKFYCASSALFVKTSHEEAVSPFYFCLLRCSHLSLEQYFLFLFKVSSLLFSSKLTVVSCKLKPAWYLGSVYFALLSFKIINKNCSGTKMTSPDWNDRHCE